MARLYGLFSFVSVIGLTIIQYQGKFDSTSFTVCFISLVAVYGIAIFNKQS